jgi:Cys-Gly metallodipeptidase DUG1
MSLSHEMGKTRDSAHLILPAAPRNYTREGGSIPVALTFSEATGKSVMLLPLGQGDDGAHGPGEKIARRNYIEGSKLLGEYLHEVAAVME